jgi:hypothetical protein
MASQTTKVRIGAKGAAAMARHSTLRRAAKPPAKVGWRVSKVVVKRKARGQFERLGAAARTFGSVIVIYGPMAAEVFELVEKPKPRRRAPAFAAGVAVGAGAMYFLAGKKRD